MFTQETRLQLITAQNFAHNYIVRTVVAEFGRAARQFANLPNNDLVRVQQSGKLHRNLLTAARRTLDPRNLSNIVCHRDAYAAEELYPLGNGVDQFHLLVEVLVEEQMQLVERRPGNLPVRFLV